MGKKNDIFLNFADKMVEVRSLMLGGRNQEEVIRR